MQTEVSIKVTLCNEMGVIKKSDSTTLRAYPTNGLYWIDSCKDIMDGVNNVSELLKKLSNYYEGCLFAETDDKGDIGQYSKVIIEEMLSGDFTYFELEAIAEDAEIDPNDAVKTVFVWATSNGIEDSKTVYAIDENEQEIDITPYITMYEYDEEDIED